jgi:cytosine/creatinine deaminase
MLVLSRQRDQTVMIGDDIEVTVVDVRGDKVRLGINAPKHVAVHRKEVYEAIRRENQAAARVRPEDLTRGAGLPGQSQAPHMRIHRPDGSSAAGGSSSSAAVAPAPLSPAAPARADEFMKAAVAEAKKGLAEGGLPIGSVLVRDGQIVARGHNRRVQKGDPMAHAEIDCLTVAGRQKTYKDTVLYSTLMPCFLCSGAIIQFGIPKVVAGESVNFHGGADLLRQQGVEVTDLHDPECIDMMSRFIREHPELWNEDIGK